MIGWVKFHRRIANWEWYTEANVFRVFFHLVLMANHKEKKWRGVIVKRGQLITSYRKLALALDLTKPKIRTALNKLEPNEITRETTSQYTLINIVNYEVYQKKELENKTQNHKQNTNKSQTKHKQITTNKNVKNVKNDNKQQHAHTRERSVVVDTQKIKKVQEMLKDKVTPSQAAKLLDLANNNLDTVQEKVEVMEEYAENNTVKNVHRYMMAAIKHNYKKSGPGKTYTKKKSNNKFHQFQKNQNNYTEDELDKKLGIK